MYHAEDVHSHMWDFGIRIAYTSPLVYQLEPHLLKV